MGRLLKTTESQVNKTVIIPSKSKKLIYKVPMKRLAMLQRRLWFLLDEQSCWEEKNNNLLHSLNAEKMLTASLRKETFHWQKLYHEAMIEINTYKVKLAEMAETMATNLREINSIYPHVVAFLESVTSNKIRISNMLASISLLENECLQDEGDSTKRKRKTIKHSVDPLVGEFPVIKQKTILERTSQDVQTLNNDSYIMEDNNQLTPIPEVDHEEDISLERISLEPKRKVRRTCWRLRRQKRIEKDPKKDMGRKIKTSANDGDSSHAEINPINLSLVHAVQIEDVTSPLQNSSPLKVHSGYENKTVQESSKPSEKISLETMRGTAEDTLKDSLVFNDTLHNLTTYQHPLNTEDLRSSICKSGSSDDEGNFVVIRNNASNLSFMNSLVINNKTLVFQKNRKSSLSPDTSLDSLDDFQATQPKPANIIDVQRFNNVFHENSLENVCESSSPASLSKSLVNSSSTCDENNPSPKIMEAARRVSLNGNSVTVHFSSKPDVRSPASNISSERNSLGVSDKRIRKPKVLLYPGEEEALQKTRRSKSVGKSINRRKSGKKSSINTSNKDSRKTLIPAQMSMIVVVSSSNNLKRKKK